MPQVKLLVNIGSADAVKLGLDFPDECREGETVDVGEKVAAELLKRGWAVAEGEDARAVAARNPAEPQQQASAAPSGILAPIIEESGTRRGRKAKAAPAEGEESDADTSPLSEENATDAIDHISRMRSRERLQQIAANDKRDTVKAAAQKRLGEL